MARKGKQQPALEALHPRVEAAGLPLRTKAKVGMGLLSGK